MIDVQRQWRSAKDRMSDAWGERTIDVRQLIDSAGTRTPADPFTKATRATAKMSDDERRKMIALLEQQISDAS